MASFEEHIVQARHNELLANLLLENPAVRDWTITIAFYAAVHIAEACFAKDPDIGHSEKACKDHRVHDFRQDEVEKKSEEAYRAYHKLRMASQKLRYLGEKTGQSRVSIWTFYSQKTAEEFVITNLPLLRAELGKAFGVDVSLERKP